MMLRSDEKGAVLARSTPRGSAVGLLLELCSHVARLGQSSRFRGMLATAARPPSRSFERENASDVVVLTARLQDVVRGS